MNEKRKVQRRYLLYYMRVFNAADLQQIGNMVDITPYGLMVVSENIIPEKTTFRLRMELTEEVSSKAFMEFTARSIWSHADISPFMYNTGFEIVEIAPENAEIIQRIVEAFGFRDNELK